MSALPPEGPDFTPPDLRLGKILSAERLVPPGLTTSAISLVLAALYKFNGKLPGGLSEIITSIPNEHFIDTGRGFAMLSIALLALRALGAGLTDEEGEAEVFPNKTLEIDSHITSFRQGRTLSFETYQNLQNQVELATGPEDLAYFADLIFQLAASHDALYNGRLQKSKEGVIPEGSVAYERGEIMSQFLTQIGLYPAAMVLLASTNLDITETMLKNYEFNGYRIDHDPRLLAAEAFVALPSQVRPALLFAMSEGESRLSQIPQLCGTRDALVRNSLQFLNTGFSAKLLTEKLTNDQILDLRRELCSYIHTS